MKVPWALPILFCTVGAAFASEQNGMKGIDLLKDGRAAFESFCGDCHSLDVPLAAIVEPGAWNTLLDAMVSRGASLPSEEAARIASYLEARSLFDMKCPVCHDRDRCLSRKKTHSQWRQTVKKMALRAEGGISRDEAAVITDYLAVVCPGEEPILRE